MNRNKHYKARVMKTAKKYPQWKQLLGVYYAVNKKKSITNMRATAIARKL